MSLVSHRDFVGLPETGERLWLIPSALMTGLLGVSALLLMPLAGYDEIPPYFGRFVNFMNFIFVGVILLMACQLFRMWQAGITEPVAHLRGQFRSKRTILLAAIAGVMLAATDMLFFMWIKPEITGVAPFWADRLFADIDYAIFGTDPWRFFQGTDLTFHAWAYSFLWAVAIMATLVWLFAKAPSRERSVSLLSYFALWSVFGPIGQLLFSSAGPIFYSRAGLGDRFAELEHNIPEVTQDVSRYLWSMHTNGELGVGAGVSAMPSLHIATVTWVALSFVGHRSRLAPVAILFALYIFALSVALGWHYAVDGIVGAVGAFGTQAASRAYVKGRLRKAAVRELVHVG